ncbi:MAG: Substrate-specific component BioY of biotin ECF transporter [Ignavibacteriae bacterium]|nr:MAG: Substrate-specific component BioY of biotin ECF transporter [Ignavibacteriota bacterium]
MNNNNFITQKLVLVKSENLIKDIAVILLFSVLTAIGAWIEIPTKPVPFTLQTFFVLLSGAILGARKGFYSQLIYLSMGLIGLPVFAGFSAGILKMIGPTGGYLLSFPLSAFITGYLINKRNSYFWALFSVTVGMILVFLLGTIYLNFVYFKDIYKSIAYGFVIFSWWDAIKIIAVASIYKKFIGIK